MTKKYAKIVIGVDQSYTVSGVSVIADGKPLKVSSINYKGIKTPTEKRQELARVLDKLLIMAQEKAEYVAIYCERIRTVDNSARGYGAKKAFGGNMNINYIKKTAALVAVIVDVAFKYGVTVFSVDTRSWKSRVVGNSKASVRKGKLDKKMETVIFVQEKYGIDLYLRDKRGTNEPIYDHDAADSCCLGLYGFLPMSEQKTKIED